MPTAPTSTAPLPGPIKLRSATAQPAAAAPPPEPTAASPVVPEPLGMALNRLTSTVQKDITGATVVYRSHVESLARDVRLSGAEMDGLAHALRVLNLTPADVKADVAAIHSHRAMVKAQAGLEAVVIELERESPGWMKEEEVARRRLAEIQLARKRLESAHMSVGLHKGEVSRIIASNPRVMGSLEQAVAKATAPAAGPYQPRVIRSSDDALTPPAVVPMEVPGLLIPAG